jgi:hypothetical protein
MFPFRFDCCLEIRQCGSPAGEQLEIQTLGIEAFLSGGHVKKFEGLAKSGRDGG